MIELPFDNIFSFINVIINTFLVHVTILVEPFVEVGGVAELLRRGLVELIMELDLVARVLLENVVDGAHQELFYVLVVV